MSFFKPRTVPGAVWPAVPPQNVSPIWSAYLTLDRTQWMSSKDIVAGQLAQLRALIDHCAKNVPYYRRALARTPFPQTPLVDIAQVQTLPVLTREAYQSSQSEMAAVSLPPGVSVVGKPHFTSGTTGVPLRVLRTNLDELWQAAFCMRDFEWSGLDPRKTLAAIRLFAMTEEDLPASLSGLTSSAWVPFAPHVFQNGWAHGMDVRQDPVKQLEWLFKVKPAYLISYPSNLEALAALLRESKRHLPGLEAIQCIGETLTPESEVSISAAFRAPVKNLYSVTEGGYVASPCPEGHGLHVHSENFVVEVVDDAGAPVEPGGTGRVLLTSLHNFVTPFIRYDVRDYVTTAEGPCPCGRGLPLWKRVEGRRHPMLRTHDGSLRISTGLILGVRRVGGISQFQIVQKASGEVVVRVVTVPEWTDEHEAQMRLLVRKETGFPGFVERVPALGRQAGGKMQLVVVEPTTP